MHPLLSHERLTALLAYDADTGHFIHRQDRGPGRAGCRAGSVATNGYEVLFIDRQQYHGHRLAWFYVHGSWPADQIDHINGIRDDNRISNLREASAAENSHNIKRKKSNTSGYTGVSFNKTQGKWQARMRVDGKVMYLGSFSTPEEGAEVYNAAAKRRSAFVRA